MRVVTLLPSATEIVCALDIDPVGVTHECDYPPRIASRPTVVHSAIDTNGTSGAIDREVKAATANDGVYDLDRDRLRKLDPDVVITQRICDLCAIDHSIVEETIADLGLDAELVATHPHTLEDVLDDIERIGQAIDREQKAAKLRADLERRIETVHERTAELSDRPSVTVLDWFDPLMISGHWVPELVQIAGGKYRLSNPGVRSKPIEWSTLQSGDPDIIITAPCGFSLEQTSANLDDLTSLDGWESLDAVERNQTYAIDGNHYVNRPGPRLVDTLEFLASILHPEYFPDPPSDAVSRVEALSQPT